MDVLKGLNQEQLKAVETIDGPVLIIAGPGTGKTKTLVHRTLNLIVNHNVSPENIMIVTFTNKAAKELITRISNELIELNFDINLNEMYIGTFHSICLRILEENLKYAKIDKNFTLLDDFDQQYFIYRNLPKLINVHNSELVSMKSSFWQKSDELKKIINNSLEELVDTAKLSSDSNLKIKELGETLKRYEEIRVEQNLLDFTSIQLETYHLLINNPDVLDDIKEKIKYLMVDEYQDTNYIQEKLVFLITENSKNICVVGDDDQGLYRFRGATIRNILEFPDKFKSHLTQITLTKNYRSEKDIVKFYNEWIKHTHTNDYNFEWENNRFDKKIEPVKSKFNATNTVMKLSGNREKKDFNINVLNFIKNLEKSGKLSDLNQIAFLFRSVKHPRVKNLANYLEDNNVNVYSPRSELFFERDEIKIIIGVMLFIFPQYIRNMFNNNKNELNDIQKYYVECLKTAKDEIKKHKDLLNFSKNKAALHLNLRKNTDYAFSGLIYQMLEFKPLSNIIDVDLTSSIVDSRPARNVSLLIDMFVKFEYLHRINILSPKNLNKSLNYLFDNFFKFLLQGGINEYEDDEEYAPSGCVSFLTIHQAKGMEFPITIVDSLYSVPRDQISEVHTYLAENKYIRNDYEPAKLIKYYDFWRLYYTAFSRAQNLLVLLADEKKNGHQKEPSYYFKDLYDSLPVKTDYNIMDFEKVKNNIVKNTYAFTSHIQLYETCPMQYKFYRELSFKPVRKGALIYGELIHQTIDEIHKNAKTTKRDSFTDQEITDIFEKNYFTLSKKEQYYINKNILSTALKHILSYVKSKKDFNSVYDSEITISLVKDKYILSGKVDLIESVNNNIELIDFKTEKKPDLEIDKDKIYKHKKQLEIYAHILNKRYEMGINKVSLYYTGESNGVPRITFNLSANQVVETIKDFDETVKNIEMKLFNKRTNDLKVCRECDMRYYCKRNREDN